MIGWTIYICFLGVLLLTIIPRENHRAIRIFALLSAIASLVIGVVGTLHYSPNPSGAATVAKLPWVQSLGIEYYLAVDGISLVMVLLTGIAAVIGILFSWNIEDRVKEFFCFYLTLIGAVYGVFLSFDLFLFFVFYELAIVPKYFLIAIWGSTNREYGAMKLALYSFIGSAMILVVLLAAYVVSGAKTFNLVELSKFQFPVAFQMWALPLMLAGFGILAGLWPFHTWAPTGHVAAPTAASMLLAGVVMKLGAYGALRVAMTLFPRGLDDWVSRSHGLESWREVFALLALIGIVYGAMVAFVGQLGPYGAGELFADILQLRVRRRKLRRQGEDAAAELRFAFVVGESRNVAAVPHHREDRLALVVQSDPGRGRDDIEKRRTHVVAKYRTLRYLLLTR